MFQISLTPTQNSRWPPRKFNGKVTSLPGHHIWPKGAIVVHFGSPVSAWWDGVINGGEYVRCSNWACGYFCTVQNLASFDCKIQIPIPQVANNNFINSFYFHQSFLKAMKCWGKGKERNFIKGANLLTLED